MSDLHLNQQPSSGQLTATGELADAVTAATGPGAILIAGNLFDSSADAAAALRAHPALSSSVAAYAGGHGRRVIVMPGDRDARLAWSGACTEAVTDILEAEMAFAVDLEVHTAAGTKKVRVEPGYALDSLARLEDPRNPRETPYAQHIRDELLPSVRARQGGTGTGWLTGIEQLDEPAALSRFIASRLVYRRLVHSAWLLLVPVVAALILRVPTTVLRSARHGALTTRVGLFVFAAFIELLFLVALALVAVRRTNRALSALSLDEEGRDPNEAPRAQARTLVTSGYAGLITGHTCRPELAHLGHGFYANAGAGADVVTEYPCRIAGIGLPSVFLGHRILAWVELEAGNDLHVRLLHARQDLPGSSFIERIMAKREPISGPSDLRADVVATFPQGQAWPRPQSRERHDRRVRRLAAAVMIAVGFLSLVSAMSDPIRDRLDDLRELFPLYIPQTAAALAAIGGVGLIVLARGIRRGQRRAWLVCLVVLLTVAVLHLIKGVDVEETLISLAGAAFLWINRRSFQAKTDVLEVRKGLGIVITAGLLTVLAGALALELSQTINHSRFGHHLSWVQSFQASAERMLGITNVPLPHRIDEFFAPTMTTATVGLVLALLVVMFRPVVARRHREVAWAPTIPGSPTSPLPTTNGASSGGFAGGGEAGLTRARAIVARHGRGTLDYFALRPDKDFFFWGDTVVALRRLRRGVPGVAGPDRTGLRARGGVAGLPSPRRRSRLGSRRPGRRRGVAADLPGHRMHDLYVGDEAVVRVSRFTLEGGDSRVCARRSTGSPSTATGSVSMIRPPSTPLSEICSRTS